MTELANRVAVVTGAAKMLPAISALEVSPEPPRSPVAASITLNTIGDFTYTRRTRTLTNATYTIWTSTDLNTWVQDPGATQTVTSTANEVEVVSVGLSVTLLTGDKRFVQVRAATP